MAFLDFRQHGGITHVFDHPILGEIVEIICLSSQLFEFPPIEVYWGIHRVRPVTKSKSIRIGIQTEQFRDESGSKIGSPVSLSRIFREILRYDFIIDINQSNLFVYKTLPKFLRRKILLGPYIFPEERSLASVHGGSNAVFFGSLNERRTRILESIPKKFSVNIIPDKTFGSMLNSSLQNAWCILNVHYYNGTYTEYPRLLKAISCGKPVVSESLDSMLIAGHHYMNLSELFHLNFKEASAEAQIQYDNLSLYLTQNYSFRSGLRQCLGL